MSSKSGHNGNEIAPVASPPLQRALRLRDKLGYSLGHIFNDVSAALWSGYTLLFLQGVQQMPRQQAGALLMVGQVCGAIMTTITGCLVDKVGTKRKWHALGTSLTLLSFPSLYSICPFCDDFAARWKFFYYAIVVLVFQSSYSIVQVTHLAMIPDLSRTKRDRSDLTAMRQSTKLFVVIIVYAVTWLVLRTKASDDDKISPTDTGHFRVSLVRASSCSLLSQMKPF